MIDGPTLFDYLPTTREPFPAYQHASPTSRAAAVTVTTSGHARSVRAAVLSALLNAPAGLTQKDLERLTHYSRASLASACNWLAGGKVLASGDRERTPMIMATSRVVEGCAVYQHHSHFRTGARA